MECARVLLLVGLVAATSALPAERSVPDDILKGCSGVLGLHGTVGARYRRQSSRSSSKTEFGWFSRINDPWCFCGTENWFVKLMENNIVETTSCLREANLNFTTDHIGVMEKLTVTARKNQCAYECIFRKTNLLDSDDKLNKTAIKDMYKSKVFEEKGLKETADTALDRCLSTGTEFTVVSDSILALAKGTNCNQEQYKFHLCLILEMSRNCPENLKKPEVYSCNIVYENLETTRRTSNSTTSTRV